MIKEFANNWSNYLLERDIMIYCKIMIIEFQIKISYNFLQEAITNFEPIMFR